MKILAAICNIVLFVFTCLVLASEGPPRGAAYVVLAVWLFLTLILSSVVIFRAGASGSSKSPLMRTVAIICNIVLLGFICWALADGYPHPQEEGFIPYVVLTVLAPALNLVALSSNGARERRLSS